MHVQNSLQAHDTFWGFSNNSSSNNSRDWLIIGHLHNGNRFKYSFMCILISLLCFIQVQIFYSITDTETWPRRLMKMHIKEYLNRSPLCKWSITGKWSSFGKAPPHGPFESYFVRSISDWTLERKGLKTFINVIHFLSNDSLK